MSVPGQFSRTVCFDEFELNLETAELKRNGSEVILPGQPFQVLVALLNHPGQLVTREDLKKQLWPSDTFVDFDQSLNKAVNRLREALGDSAESPHFIETLPRKGYRFIGVVTNGAGIGTATAATSNQPEAGPSSQGHTGEKAQEPRALSFAFRYALAVAIPCLIGALILIPKWFLRHATPDLANVRINKVTDSGGTTGVAISPDGRYIVYSLRRGKGESLRLRQISTRSEVEILPVGPGFHGLTFSPNGDYIYFTRSDPNEPRFKYLYSVPLLGGPVRQMIADVDSPVAFSPTGQQFVFERALPRRNLIELRIANTDGSAEHAIATIPNGDAGLFQPGPTWSRDGRTIVCPFRILGREIRWILAAVSVPDGRVREIYSDTAPFGRPAWLSGLSLLIPRYDAAYDRWQLWTFSYPDGNPQRFTNDLANYDMPLDVTSDGKIIAAMASTVVSNIWESSADNPSLARQVTFGQLPMLNVAEATSDHLLASGDGKAWMVKSDGQSEVFTDLHHVGWIGACGALVLLTSFEDNVVTLSRLGNDTPHPRRLFGGDLSRPGCSQDGRFVYYVNRHRPQKIWRLSTDGGLPVEISDGLGEGIASGLDVSPDGALLAFTFIQYHPNLLKLAVMPASGGPTMHTFDVPGETTRVHWSPAGTGLHYLVAQDGATNIWEQSLAGGNPKQLTKFTSGQIFDFTWSFDRRRLLLTRGDETSDVVLLSIR